MSLDMYGEKVADACELIRKLTGGTEWFGAFDRSAEDTLELFIAAMDEVRQQSAARIAELERESSALSEVIGCFEAAEVEGLSIALAETTDERLKDLIERRVMHAYHAATSAKEG